MHTKTISIVACLAVMSLVGCGKKSDGDKRDKTASAADENERGGPAARQDDRLRATDRALKTWEKLAPKAPSAPEDHLDATFLRGPFPTLEALCEAAVAASYTQTKCVHEKLSLAATGPILGAAVVRYPMKKADEVFLSVLTKSGWYVSPEYSATVGVGDGLRHRFVITRMTVKTLATSLPPILMIEWVYATDEVKSGDKFSTKNKLATTICGGDKNDPLCAKLLAKVGGASRAGFLTLCTVGKSKRPSCTQLTVFGDRKKKRLRIKREFTKKGEVIAEAVENTLRDSDLWDESDKVTWKLFFP